MILQKWIIQDQFHTSLNNKGIRTKHPGKLGENWIPAGIHIKQPEGFTPNKSTTENIYDLFQFWMNIKNSNNKKFGTLIFINLKRAYDRVNRNLLLKLLKEAKVPGKIIEIIKIMFSKSWISFGNKLM